MSTQEFLPDQLEINFAVAAKIASMAGRPANVLARYPNRLREVRELKGLTQAKLAKMCGKSTPTLQRWETGERELKVFELERLARILHVRPQRLLISVDPIEDQQEEIMLATFRRLSPDERDRLIRIARALDPESQGRKTAS